MCPLEGHVTLLRCPGPFSNPTPSSFLPWFWPFGSPELPKRPASAHWLLHGAPRFSGQLLCGVGRGAWSGSGDRVLAPVLGLG